jgi:carbon-monoxide dehydrogenase small subunit
MNVSFRANGKPVALDLEPRMTLADALRERCGLTGTHLGCEHGVCGACTVLLDGEPVRACLIFAVQCEGAEVTTVEGLSDGNGGLHPIQEAFKAEHGLQCGFCTPGMMVCASALLARDSDPDEETIRWELSGNLCRCTGYMNIVKAVKAAAEQVRAQAAKSRPDDFRSVGADRPGTTI